MRCSTREARLLKIRLTEINKRENISIFINSYLPSLLRSKVFQFMDLQYEPTLLCRAKNEHEFQHGLYLTLLLHGDLNIAVNTIYSVVASFSKNEGECRKEVDTRTFLDLGNKTKEEYLNVFI